MPLITCKIYLELNWIEDCILSSAGNSAKFPITDSKLHIPIVTSSNKDRTYLAKQLNEEFKRSVNWNSYETHPTKVIEQGKNIYKLLRALFQGVKILFILAYLIDDTDDTAGIKNNEKYFLPRGDIKNYNLLTDGRNFYDQPINNIIKQYDEIRKVSTRYGNDYTTGFLLDYAFFKRQLQTYCC